MIKTFREKIKNLKLTKTEKIIAEYFLRTGDKIFFMKSSDIAKDLNTSDSSVIRFVKTLGFENFSQFKEIMQKEISKKVLTPSEKLIKNKNVLESDQMENSFFDNVNLGISKIFTENSKDNLQAVSELLLKCKKKFIIGFKSTSGVSSFFGLRLGFIMPEVRTHSLNNSELMKSIIDITEGDCLVIMAFPKYSKTYNLLIDIAQKVKAKIIIITDSPTSPVADKGDITIFVNNSGISYFNSLIPMQIFLEYILTDISRKIGVQGKERLNLINEYLNQNL